VALGLACGGVVALALGPDRVRRGWLALAAAGLVALASGRLLDPYDAFTGGLGPTNAGAIRRAADALILVSAVAFVGAFLVALFDNGLRAGQVERLRPVAAAG